MGANKEWVKSEVMDFINMYHNKPALWDVKSKVYRDRVKKLESLLEMAAKFGTTDEISRKIHNLRNQFNELIKVSKKKSRQGTDDQKWPYYKYILFLQSGLICRSSVGNIATDGADADAVEENENAYNTQNDNEDLPQTQNQEVYAEENSGTINQKTPITPRKKRKCDEPNVIYLYKKLNAL